MRLRLLLFFALLPVCASADSLNLLQPGQSTNNIPLLSEGNILVLADTGSTGFTTAGFNTGSGTPLGNFSSAIFTDSNNPICSGCLTVDFGIFSNGAIPITSITLTGFGGALIEVGALAGSALPVNISRSADGGSITFDFGTSGLSSGLAAFVLETNVACNPSQQGSCKIQFNSANLTFNGGNVTLVNFSPVPVPEEDTLMMVGTGAIACAGAMFLRKRPVV